jgi:hypothetical protein
MALLGLQTALVVWGCLPHQPRWFCPHLAPRCMYVTLETIASVSSTLLPVRIGLGSRAHNCHAKPIVRCVWPLWDTGDVSTLAGSGLAQSVDEFGTNASFVSPLRAAFADSTTLFVIEASSGLRVINLLTGEASSCLPGVSVLNVGFA